MECKMGVILKNWRGWVEDSTEQQGTYSGPEGLT